MHNANPKMLKQTAQFLRRPIDSVCIFIVWQIQRPSSLI